MRDQDNPPGLANVRNNARPTVSIDVPKASKATAKRQMNSAASSGRRLSRLQPFLRFTQVTEHFNRLPYGFGLQRVLPRHPEYRITRSDKSTPSAWIEELVG